MNIKRLNPAILLSLLIIWAIVNKFNTDENNGAPVGSSTISDITAVNHIDGELTIKYIDVGQGDSELIILPDGRSILIDAGDLKHDQVVSNTINDEGITTINYLVATHPHADHIGGMEHIVKNFDIENVYMPRADHDSKTYLYLLQAISEKHLKINTVRAGLVMIDEPELRAEFVAPNSSSYEKLNDYSAVLKLSYKNTDFIFCGDAETLSEDEMLSAGYDLSADVLKAGHHGSSTSTSDAFLNAVNPKYAVISCAAGNSYGHPHRETIEKLNAKNVSILRTDQMGTITVYSDGDKINVFTEKE